MRRTFLVLGLLALAAPVAAYALMQPSMPDRFRPFTTAEFQAAQSAGQPILVDVHAGWCPVCRRQAPILEQLANEPVNRNLVVFRLDFDKQKAEQRPLRVTRQSTLIAFRGERETGRSVGETDAGKISDLIATTR